MTFTNNPLSFFDPPPTVNGEPSRPSSSNYTETTSPSSTGDPLVQTPSNNFLHFPTLAEIMSAGLGDNGPDNKSTPEDNQTQPPSTFLSSYYSDSSRETLLPSMKTGSGSGSPTVHGDNSGSASLDWSSSFQPWTQGSSGSSCAGQKGGLLAEVEMSASKSNREMASTGIWEDLGHHPIPINIDTSHTNTSSKPEQTGDEEEEAFLSFLETGLDKRKSDQEDASPDPFAALQPRQPTPNSSQSHPSPSSSPFTGDSSSFWVNQRYPLPSTFGSTSSPIVPPSAQVSINTLSPQSLQIPHSSNPPLNALAPGAMPAPYSSTSTSPLRLPSILPPLPSSQSPYHRYHDPLSLHDPRPASAGYPVSLFGNVPLPEMENNWQGGGGNHAMGLGQGEAQMSGGDYAQVSTPPRNNRSTSADTLTTGRSAIRTHPRCHVACPAFFRIQLVNRRATVRLAPSNVGPGR